ncbi:carbohydrate ABC transporter permease, partial [Rhizobium phaseoli]
MTIEPILRHPHSVSAGRRRLLRRIGIFVSYTGLSLVALLFLFPFFWMVSNAVRSNTEVLAVPVRILPEEYHWDTFIEALVSLPFGTFLLNSFIFACSVTAIVIVVSCLSAYAFARLRFPGREGLLLTYLSTLMIPQVMLVIPLFLVVSKLGWINTYHGMILPVAFSSFGTFLLRQFILGIPKDLDEAAMM